MYGSMRAAPHIAIDLVDAAEEVLARTYGAGILPSALIDDCYA